MSIGKREIYYTLTDVDDTSKVYRFKYCKCHAEGNGSGEYNFYCDGLGDDILPYLYSIYYKGSEFSKRFYFNGLVGCILTVNAGGGYSNSRVHLFISGAEYEYEKTCQVYCDIEGLRSGASSPNSANIKCGLMFGYLDNNLYTEGISIIPFHIPARFNNAIVEKVHDYALPYQQLTSNSYGIQAGSGWVGTVWDTFNIFPARYLLKDYHTLSFSDSGDIKKQQPLVAEGFPYGDGESTSQGGQGDMIDESAPIPIDEPRTLFVGNLFRVYNMTVTALSELSNFLLDPSFTASVSKLFNDPMDYLTSLVAIPYGAFNGSNEELTIGTVASGITAFRLNNFIADLDCGEIELKEYFESFMDYSPYTRITLYLPMIGYVSMNVDAFQNDKIHLKYRVDVLTGQCVAFLSNDTGLIGSYNGNCAYHIPLRSRDYSQMISGIANTAASTLIGGVSAPSFNGALNGALNFKPGGSVTTAGSFSGNSGVLTNKKPYIIIERPRISIPRSYPNTKGYMSRISAKLGDLKGFTRIEEIHLEHINASAEEKQMIESLLKEGVIL